MEELKETLKEIRGIIEGGVDEIIKEKQLVSDKITKQFSVKIPKSLALKAELTKDSIFAFVFNLKEGETKEEINKSKLVIYLKEVGNEKEKRGKKEKTKKVH